MSKIIKVIEKLDSLLSLKPATANDIRNVEIELALPLAEEYKEYVQAYGAIIADDVELTGIAKSKNRDVIQVTKREWAANSKIKHNMYVIENVGIDGIIIWQDVQGAVYESRPNRAAVKIADSLAEYLKLKKSVQ